MSDETSNNRLIAIIMVCILLWGAVLAIGAYAAPGFVPNGARVAVVYAFVTGFTVIWAMLLRYRKSHRD